MGAASAGLPPVGRLGRGVSGDAAEEAAGVWCRSSSRSVRPRRASAGSAGWPTSGSTQTRTEICGGAEARPWGGWGVGGEMEGLGVAATGVPRARAQLGSGGGARSGWRSLLLKSAHRSWGRLQGRAVPSWRSSCCGKAAESGGARRFFRIWPSGSRRSAGRLRCRRGPRKPVSSRAPAPEVRGGGLWGSEEWLGLTHPRPGGHSSVVG